MTYYLIRRTREPVATYGRGVAWYQAGRWVDFQEYDYCEADFETSQYSVHRDRILREWDEFMNPREVAAICAKIGLTLEGWNDPETLAASAAADPDGCNTGLYSGLPDGRSDRPATDEVTHAVS